MENIVEKQAVKELLLSGKVQRFELVHTGTAHKTSFRIVPQAKKDLYYVYSDHIVEYRKNPPYSDQLVWIGFINRKSDGWEHARDWGQLYYSHKPRIFEGDPKWCAIVAYDIATAYDFFRRLLTKKGLPDHYQVYDLGVVEDNCEWLTIGSSNLEA